MKRTTPCEKKWGKNNNNKKRVIPINK